MKEVYTLLSFISSLRAGSKSLPFAATNSPALSHCCWVLCILSHICLMFSIRASLVISDSDQTSALDNLL